MDIERELEYVIENNKGEQVGVGQVRVDWLAEDCLQEIIRLKETIEFYKKRQEESCKWCEDNWVYSDGQFGRYDIDDIEYLKLRNWQYCPNCGRLVIQHKTL